MKNAIGNLAGIALNLYTSFGSIIILIDYILIERTNMVNIDSSNPKTWYQYVFLSLCVFNFFHQDLTVFTV